MIPHRTEPELEPVDEFMHRRNSRRDPWDAEFREHRQRSSDFSPPPVRRRPRPSQAIQ